MKENKIAGEIRPENDYLVELSKTYEFEGQNISELDFSPVEDLKFRDLDNLIKTAKKQDKTLSDIMPEMSLSFTKVLAQKVCNLPFEFFEGLNISDAKKLNNAVISFLYR